jgi:hypothetical protein
MVSPYTKVAKNASNQEFHNIMALYKPHYTPYSSSRTLGAEKCCCCKDIFFGKGGLL